VAPQVTLSRNESNDVIGRRLRALDDEMYFSQRRLVNIVQPAYAAEVVDQASCKLLTTSSFTVESCSLFARGPEMVKVTGSLSTNNGEIARQWCLDGRGILLRSMWDIKDDLQSGPCTHRRCSIRRR